MEKVELSVGTVGIKNITWKDHSDALILAEGNGDVKMSIYYAHLEKILIDIPDKNKPEDKIKFVEGLSLTDGKKLREAIIALAKRESETIKN